MQKPSVGQQVHYVSHGTPVRADGSQAFTSQCRAAVVTQVNGLEGMDAAQAEIEQWDDHQRLTVGLCVINPTGLFFHEKVWQDDRRAGGWHWPGPGCR